MVARRQAHRSHGHPAHRRGPSGSPASWRRRSRAGPIRSCSRPRWRAPATPRRVAGFPDAVVDDDLREWDYGDYEGRTTSEIRAADDPGWFLWDDGVPNGETLDDVAKRADRVIARVRAVDGDVLVFAHGHCLRVLAARWLDRDAGLRTPPRARPGHAVRARLGTQRPCPRGLERARGLNLAEATAYCAAVRGDAELQRLDEDREGTARWKWWGPYLPARQWGTVREDYSAGGTAWDYFPHDHARSRAYRWGEDGLGGICDRWQHLCFAIALWNGNDPILKERLFGLTNSEGNHGEDVKEYWWPLDSTPTHSWMRWLYKYPQRAFPYDDLVAENRRRGVGHPEYELIDTGVFDDDRYFDVELTYAKASPDDICIVIECTNRGPDAAPLHVLPTLWFRNTWSWGRDERHPWLQLDGDHVEASHALFGQRWLAAEGATSETLAVLRQRDQLRAALRLDQRRRRIRRTASTTTSSTAPTTVNPANSGTKAAAWYRLTVDPGATATIRLRLSDAPLDDPFGADVRPRRSRHGTRKPTSSTRTLAPGASQDGTRRPAPRSRGLAVGEEALPVRHQRVARRATRPCHRPPAGREHGRNSHWPHLYNADIISMPDEWEYPWYAAWDLAFHMIPLALVDSEFAKDQLLLFCREWYMHPNGQLPAYEWAFDDVNPPVHAWAAWRVFKIDAIQRGERDWDFLERIFHKLLMNFSWWVNRKDAEGNNLFEGGFLGLGQHRSVRSVAPASERARARAVGCHVVDGDVLPQHARHRHRARPPRPDVRGRVHEVLRTLPGHRRRRHPTRRLLVVGRGRRLLLRRPRRPGRRALAPQGPLVGGTHPAVRGRDLRSPADREPARVPPAGRVVHPQAAGTVPQLPRGGFRRRPGAALPLARRSQPAAADPHAHARRDRVPVAPRTAISVEGAREPSPSGSISTGRQYEVRYQPGDSDTYLFGGNSNWRGPVWFPLNYLMIESLQKFHHYLGNDFTIEFPTGSGRECTLWEVAGQLAHRLTSICSSPMQMVAGRPTEASTASTSIRTGRTT